jgi:hypothetical protein
VLSLKIHGAIPPLPHAMVPSMNVPIDQGKVTQFSVTSLLYFILLNGPRN